MTKATTITLQTNALNDARPVFRTSRWYTGRNVITKTDDQAITFRNGLTINRQK